MYGSNSGGRSVTHENGLNPGRVDLLATVPGMRAAVIAHGIRNPLNAMEGVLEYLRIKYAEDPALTEFAGIMRQEISKFDSFISHFLCATLMQDEDAVLDVNALLGRIKIITSFQLTVRGIEARYILEEVPKVRVDAFQLGNSIMNIVNNAVEAMQNGGELGIRTRIYKSRKPGGVCVAIEVSDTGPGMAMLNKKPAIPQDGKGRGFGLFITHEFLRSCGGKLEISKNKKRGTSVRLILPVKESEPCRA